MRYITLKTMYPDELISYEMYIILLSTDQRQRKNKNGEVQAKYLKLSLIAYDNNLLSCVHQSDIFRLWLE
jgi:hypothetical protein